jgi:FkbM family methyltransferase
MRRLIQLAALGAYRAAPTQALLRTRLGRRLFETSYATYKFHLEAPGLRALRQHLAPDAWVIDVGANIGIFTLEFARWVRGSGRVIAIEPEGANYRRLLERLGDSELGPLVLPHQAAATDRDGPVRLQVRPEHPGDHRLTDGAGIEIPGVRLDTLVGDAGYPVIGLLKIDVQGAEERVLLGARDTILRCRPVILIEIDEGALRDLGSSSARVLDLLGEHGYRLHVGDRHGVSRLAAGEVIAALQRAEFGYLDVIALPPDGAGVAPRC